MTALTEALTLHASGPGQWKAHADPRYESNNGMFRLLATTEQLHWFKSTGSNEDGLVREGQQGIRCRQ